MFASIMIRMPKMLAKGRKAREEPIVDERLRAAARMLAAHRVMASVVKDLQIDVKTRFKVYPIEEVEEGADA